MTQKALLLFVFIFIWISAQSQNKDVISNKSAVVDDVNLNRNNTNEIHITHISVLSSDLKSFTPQEKEVVINSTSDNSSMKRSQTQISLSATLMSVEQVSESKTISRQAIIVDKTQRISDKKRVTITNLSATKIEN